MVEKKTTGKKTSAPKKVVSERKARTFSRVVDSSKPRSRAKHSSGTGPRNNYK